MVVFLIFVINGIIQVYNNKNIKLLGKDFDNIFLKDYQYIFVN